MNKVKLYFYILELKSTLKQLLHLNENKINGDVAINNLLINENVELKNNINILNDELNIILNDMNIYEFDQIIKESNDKHNIDQLLEIRKIKSL